MTRHILLHDAACSTCARIASEIEELGLTNGGRLELRSLHEPAMQGLMDVACPNGWKWEPTLVEVDDSGESARAWTGAAMVLPLVKIVGARRAQQIARVVNARGSDRISRRSALGRITAFAAAVPLVTIGGAGVLGAPPARSTAVGALTVAEAREAYRLLQRSEQYREVTRQADGRGFRRRVGIGNPAPITLEDGTIALQGQFVRRGPPW